MEKNVMERQEVKEKEKITNKENINDNDNNKEKDDYREIENQIYENQTNNKIIIKRTKNKNNLLLKTTEIENQENNNLNDKNKERNSVGKVIISPVFGKCATPNNKWKCTILSPARTYNKNTTLDSPCKEFPANGHLNHRTDSGAENFLAKDRGTKMTKKFVNLHSLKFVKNILNIIIYFIMIVIYFT